MVRNYETTETDIPEIAKKYGDYLCTVDLNRLFTSNHYASDVPGKDRLQWKNPESIDTGATGIILFLLEMYRQAGEQQYLDAANNLVDELLDHCKNTPTNNYALYTGRSGVIYMLIQLYSITGDHNLIETSLELIRPANKEFLQSKYISDHLYDGRAGTLLLIFHLYLHSKADFLVDYINEFINKIISNARFSDNGISWSSEEELHLRPSCGFAQGAAGIRYVLSRLNGYCRNAAMELLIDEADRYISSCWVEEYGNWGDFRADIVNASDLKKYKDSYTHDLTLFLPNDDCSWANGTAGILFSLLDKNGSASELANEKLIAAVAGDAFESSDLYGGLPGLGMFFLGVANRDSDYQLQRIASRIAKGQLSAAEVNLQGGLMHGQLGSVYFLLRSACNGTPLENVLFPFMHANEAYTEPVFDLLLNIPDVCKQLLSKNYPRTICMLEKAAPHVLEDYLLAQAAGSKDEIERFNDFMHHESGLLIPGALHERLMDVYYLENEKFRFFHAQQRSPLQVYLDEVQSQGVNLEYLNRPDEWLLKQTLAISDKIRIIYTKWDWSFLDDFRQMQHDNMPEKLAGNLNTSPQKHEYIFQPSGKQEFIEISLVMALKMVVHRFDAPKTVGQAAMEIRYYLQSLPEAALNDFLVAVGAARSSSVQDFLLRLDKMVLDQVRPLIYRNILVFN